MLAYGKLSKQQMAHESGGDNIGFEFSGVVVSTFLHSHSLLSVGTEQSISGTFPDPAEFFQKATGLERQRLVQEKNNKRVMGSAKNAMATKVVTRADLCWEIPDKWSLAEAATVPTAYMTAYYSLIIRGRLKKGHRVLIHSGTGAVGLAAVQISLTRGAEVSFQALPENKLLTTSFSEAVYELSIHLTALRTSLLSFQPDIPRRYL